jgi:decaprenylphospho-beta-D-ribofuranose 2-oxidase
MLSGWGRTAPTAADVVDLADDVPFKAPRGVVARGLGRGYGDAAQNAGGTVLDGTSHDTTIELDAAASRVTVSAGVSLDTLLRRIVPRGFFVPVTPGTKFVTVGGAIAADVHGKNHHQDGSIAAHLENVTLATPSGVRRVGPTTDPDLFWATAGGMGLTGAVLDASIRLQPIQTSLVKVDTDRTDDLDGVMALMEEGDHRYHYSVAWIDCVRTGRHLGRSVLTRGDFATVADLPDDRREQALDYDPKIRITAPPVFPSGLVNTLTMRVFNEAYYRAAPRRRRDELQSIVRFFHPLDAIGHWNRLYGRRGCLQYQFVVPFGAEATLRHSIEALATAGVGSVLAVLKRFGPGDAGHLSFPAAGWTLALDVPVTPGLTDLLDGLDNAIVDAGGRVYLAKDARVRRELIGAMYPRLDEWRAVRDQVDPDGVLVSDLDRRLNLTGRHP